MTNPHNDSFVYLELWAPLKILGMMKNTGDSFPVLSAVPSSGHLLLGVLHPVGAPYLSEDLSPERCVSTKQTGVIQHPAVGITTLLDLIYGMRKLVCAPGP